MSQPSQRLRSVFSIGVLLTLFGLFQMPSVKAVQPNIIFLLADDLGYMDIGANNPKSFYETPEYRQSWRRPGCVSRRVTPPAAFVRRRAAAS